jgi:predicted MFS family arabinose efflux permease
MKQAVGAAFAGNINTQAQKIARFGPTPMSSGMLADQALGQTGVGAGFNNTVSNLGGAVSGAVGGLFSTLGNNQSPGRTQ